METYLEEAAEKLFLVDTSSPAFEAVLFGIIERPGDEVFRATGGGVFLLLGTGDFWLDTTGAEGTTDLSGVLLLSLRLKNKLLTCSTGSWTSWIR